MGIKISYDEKESDRCKNTEPSLIGPEFIDPPLPVFCFKPVIGRENKWEYYC